MKSNNLARGRALEATASDGPWMVRDDCDGDDDNIWYFPVGIVQEDPSFVGVAGEPVIECAEFNGTCQQQMDNAEFICWLRNHAAALLDAAERAARLEVAAREALAVMAYDHAVTGDVDHATNEAARLLRAALEQPKGAGGA